MHLFVVPTLVSCKISMSIFVEIACISITNAFVGDTLREVQRTDAAGVSGRAVCLEWHALKLPVQPLAVASSLLHHLAFIFSLLLLCFRAGLSILRSHLRPATHIVEECQPITVGCTLPISGQTKGVKLLLARDVRCRYRSMRLTCRSGGLLDERQGFLLQPTEFGHSPG